MTAWVRPGWGASARSRYSLLDIGSPSSSTSSKVKSLTIHKKDGKKLENSSPLSSRYKRQTIARISCAETTTSTIYLHHLPEREYEYAWSYWQ